MTSKENKEKIWNFIKDVKVGMLCTVDDNVGLRARPMHLVQDEYDGTIWFFIKHDHGHIYASQQKRGEQVCLSFCDHENSVYVSLTGEASLNFDRDLIDKFWSPFSAAWFPKGKDDPQIALLEIKINKGEYWDSKSNMFAKLYEMAKANVTNETPDMGENKKIRRKKVKHTEFDCYDQYMIDLEELKTQAERKVGSFDVVDIRAVSAG